MIIHFFLRHFHFLSKNLFTASPSQAATTKYAQNDADTEQDANRTHKQKHFAQTFLRFLFYYDSHKS